MLDNVDHKNIDNETEELKQHTIKETESYKPNLLDKMILKVGDYLSFLYFIAVIITIYEVFMRYLFNSPTIWVFESSVLIVGICMLYGGTYCMANGGHIKVTVFRDILPPTIQKINDLIIAILTFIFLLSLIYAAVFMVNKAFYTPSGVLRLETSGSAWNSPMPAIMKVVLLLVVILMSLQAFLQMITQIRSCFSKNTYKTDSNCNLEELD